jgi:endonuclease YncB( thermonuclease family)
LRIGVLRAGIAPPSLLRKGRRLASRQDQPTAASAPAIRCPPSVGIRAQLGSERAAADLVGRATVTDGDTLKIRGVDVRLHGIDAPESSQTCVADGERWPRGQRSANALADRIACGIVRCEGVERDRHGRLIGVCYAGGTNLNAWLVRRGWALAYRRYSRDYVPEERRAEAESAGIWRGRFVPPWEWRHGRRLGGSGSTGGRDRDCSDFATQADAQRF